VAVCTIAGKVETIAGRVTRTRPRICGSQPGQVCLGVGGGRLPPRLGRSVGRLDRTRAGISGSGPGCYDRGRRVPGRSARHPLAFLAGTLDRVHLTGAPEPCTDAGVLVTLPCGVLTIPVAASDEPGRCCAIVPRGFCSSGCSGWWGRGSSGFV